MPLPPRQGLYDPDFERDACGLGFVASLRRQPSHDVVEQGIEILRNLTHRGAAGCDPCTGDGAGILLQIPHALYVETPPEQGAYAPLPAPGDYAVAMCFFPPDPAKRRQYEAILEATVVHHGQQVLGWRDVPIAPQALGVIARDTCPQIRQDPVMPCSRTSGVPDPPRCASVISRVLMRWSSPPRARVLRSSAPSHGRPPWRCALR